MVHSNGKCCIRSDCFSVRPFHIPFLFTEIPDFLRDNSVKYSIKHYSISVILNKNLGIITFSKKGIYLKLRKSEMNVFCYCYLRDNCKENPP